jgi:hypothetical protein
MMVCASNATERGRTEGWCDEDIASALDVDVSDISDIRSAMEGRVLDGDFLTGWKKRQPDREDGSAERARAWREKQKQAKSTDATSSPNATERNRTQPNATEPPEVDIEIDVEKIQSNNSSARTKTELLYLAVFAEKEGHLKRLFPQHDYEIVKEGCLAHYRSSPPTVDPYDTIYKWFQRQQAIAPIVVPKRKQGYQGVSDDLKKALS